jgi:hypothetical protein
MYFIDLSLDTDAQIYIAIPREINKNFYRNREGKPEQRVPVFLFLGIDSTGISIGKMVSKLRIDINDTFPAVTAGRTGVSFIVIQSPVMAYMYSSIMDVYIRGLNGA